MAIKKTRQRVREKTVNNEESLTIQSEREKTNINKIMAKYQQTGHIPQVVAKPIYADLTVTAQSFQEAMNVVQNANMHFEMLPALIRKQFDNDPVQFLQFVQNPENKEKCQEMGLFERPASTQPILETGGEAAPNTGEAPVSTPETA